MSTKFLISGKKYDLDNAFARPSLNDLVALRLETGLGVQSLRRQVAEIDTLEGGLNSDEFFDRPELMNALRALIWLARKAAGEKLTLSEANAFPWEDFDVVDDDAAAERPTKAATGSGLVVAKAAPRKRTPVTSKTSAKRS